MTPDDANPAPGDDLAVEPLTTLIIENWGWFVLGTVAAGLAIFMVSTLVERAFN